MPDPLNDQENTLAVLQYVLRAAEDYLEQLPDAPAMDPNTESSIASLAGELPADGHGCLLAVQRLTKVALAAATHSSGPRYFHLVVGGVTPAAMAADWLVSLFDQNAAGRVSSEFATEMETITLRWLTEFFGLPSSWGGALVTSATFANFTSLACATHWWGEQHGVDTTKCGLYSLPRLRVYAGGTVHPSVVKALQMLGHGRDVIEICALHETEGVDLTLLESRLRSEEGPSVIVATAGDASTAGFDPIADLADLSERFGAWLHVDAAFGLYASLSPRVQHLVKGIERADSISADGHKWLNVPYESGFAFLKHPERLGRAFGMPDAPYLADFRIAMSGYAQLGPEASRRARCLPIWASLAAYGRSGFQELVERHLDLANELAKLIEQSPNLELVYHSGFCIVCFRCCATDRSEYAGDRITLAVAEQLCSQGRFSVGTTIFRERVALRPALINWRITRGEIVEFVAAVQAAIQAIGT